MTDNVHALPNGADSVREQLKPDIDLAAALLLPNPDVLELRGQQLAIPVVNKPSPLEFFRTHPSLRLTLKMVTPDKGQPGARLLCSAARCRAGTSAIPVRAAAGSALPDCDREPASDLQAGDCQTSTRPRLG